MDSFLQQYFLFHMDLSNRWTWISHNQQQYLQKLSLAKGSFFLGTLYVTAQILPPKNAKIVGLYTSIYLEDLRDGELLI